MDCYLQNDHFWVTETKKAVVDLSVENTTLHLNQKNKPQRMRNKSRQSRKATKIRSYAYEFSWENVSSFAGLSLTEYLSNRLGLWKALQEQVPERQGKYARIDIIRGAVAGLLSGSRGTASLSEIAEDPALLKLLGIGRLPGEKIFWEELKRLGTDTVLKALDEGLAQWACGLLKHCDQKEPFNAYGFVPVFGDGSLLEGSDKREGTKYIPGKGTGLMWSNWFVGPVMATQHLSAEAEGEQKGLMDQLDGLLKKIIEPLQWRSKSLFLMDSLHGDGPTLDKLEGKKLYYVIGANKLKAAQEVLDELPEWQWQDVPQNQRRSDSQAEQTCVCWVQCADWPNKRLVVGKRFKRQGELIWNTVSVMTNLPATRLQESSQNDPGFARKVWQCYSSKMGMETYFKDVLIDLSGHRVPCNKLSHNRGYYALLSLAYNLSRGVDLIGGQQQREEKRERAKAKAHKRAPAKRMRLWNLRRKLFILPARIIVHARKVTLRFLGGGRSNWKLFESYWKAIARC